EPPGKEATNFVAWPRLLPMKSSVTFLLKCRVALTLSFVGVVPLEAPGAQVMLSFETFVLPVKRFVVGRGLACAAAGVTTTMARAPATARSLVRVDIGHCLSGGARGAHLIVRVKGLGSTCSRSIPLGTTGTYNRVDTSSRRSAGSAANVLEPTTAVRLSAGVPGWRSQVRW